MLISFQLHNNMRFLGGIFYDIIRLPILLSVFFISATSRPHVGDNPSVRCTCIARV